MRPISLEWPLDERQGFLGPVQQVVLELKLLHKGLEETIAEGLKQTAASADQCGAEETHLILFDRRPDRSWEEKIWHRTEQIGQRTIGV